MTLLLSLLTLGFAGAASAATIDCADVGCLGGTYTLDVTETSPDIWTATYTIDTTGVFSVDAELLVDVEFKVANDYKNPTLVSGPTGALEAGPLSGQGCKGKNDGFICVNLSPDLAVGGVYTWQVTFGADSLLPESDWHLGARYTSSTHRNGWVISESPAGAVPEPTAALLFGAGLLVAGSATRRRR